MTTVVCYVFVSALAAALGAQEHMRTSWLLLLLQAVPALCWVAPAYAPMRASRSRAYVSMAALRPGDKVVVIGVTGGVGQLTVARLANEGKYKVRAVGRSAERSKQVLGLDNIEYASADTKEVRRHDRLGTNVQTGIHADLVEMCCQLDSLYKPLDDADAVIIATGTSALPSPRWKVRCPPDTLSDCRSSTISSTNAGGRDHSQSFSSIRLWLTHRVATHPMPWTAAGSRTSLPP